MYGEKEKEIFAIAIEERLYFWLNLKFDGRNNTKHLYKNKHFSK